MPEMNFEMINIFSHQRKGTQNNSEIPSDTCKNGQGQTLMKTYTGEVVG